MFTDAQLAQYEERGAVTIDTPFTAEQLDRAEAAVANYSPTPRGAIRVTAP